MAKYSKEQRRCAVELYVRYECCAADVIRELGYPSREALRMWHRDWLEEQRTGVPSTRGERYARYTTEQNVFCQVGVGRFGVSFSPCERRVSGRFGVGRSCWLLVIALVIA